MLRRKNVTWIAALMMMATLWSAQSATAQRGRQPVSAQPRWSEDRGPSRELRDAAEDLDDAARDLYNIVRRETRDPNRGERYALARVADFADEASSFSSFTARRYDWDSARREFNSVSSAYQEMRSVFQNLDPSRSAWSAYREVQSEYEKVRRALRGGWDDDGGLTPWQRDYLRSAGAQIHSYAHRAYDAAERQHRSEWIRLPDRVEQLNRMSALAGAARAFDDVVQNPRARYRDVEYRFNELRRTYNSAAPRAWLYGPRVTSTLNSIADRIEDVDRTLRRR